MYVPLQVNRFAESILLIVQYRYLKSCSGDFYSPSEVDVFVSVSVPYRYRAAYLCLYLLDSDTGWRRPIGCLKLQVIFCERATNYGALLRKMTYKDKASYDLMPPCTRFEIPRGA